MQIEELQVLAADIAEGLCEAGEDFETRRRILDYLNVKVVLSFDEGTEAAELSGEFGLDMRIAFDSERRSTSRRLSHQPGSAPGPNSQEGAGGSCNEGCKRSRDCKRS